MTMGVSMNFAKLTTGTPLRLALAGACLGLLVGCQSETARTGRAATGEPRTVKLITVETDEIVRSREFVGRVVPMGTVDLSFQVRGLLESFPVVEGTIVPRGSLIAMVEQEDYELQAREAQVRLDLETRNLERNLQLLESQSIPQSVFDQAEVSFDLAELALERAERNLRHTRLEAPFDALITRRLVDSATNIDPGRPVVRVQDVSELRVQFSVPEDLMPFIDRPDDFVMEAVLPSHPGMIFPLVYREHNTEPDRFTQTYQVSVAIIEEGESRIMPGMTAIVRGREKAARHGASGIPVPVAALVGEPDGGFSVWVYNTADSTVSPRGITVVPLDSESVLATEGLESGETIVAAGTAHLMAGQTVSRWEGF